MASKVRRNHLSRATTREYNSAIDERSRLLNTEKLPAIYSQLTEEQVEENITGQSDAGGSGSHVVDFDAGTSSKRSSSGSEDAVHVKERNSTQKPRQNLNVTVPTVPSTVGENPDIVIIEPTPPPKSEKKKAEGGLQVMNAQWNFTQRCRARDQKITIRVCLIFLNVLVSLALAVASLEMEFANRVAHLKGDEVNDCVDANGGCLFDSWVTDTMKLVITCLTIVGELQMIELLRKRVHNRMEQMRDEQILREKLKRGPDSKLTSAQIRRMKLLKSPLFSTVFEHYRTRTDYVRFFMYIPHLIPFIPTVADKYLCLFMFTRLYWALEVLRVFDSTYRLRHLAFKSTFQYSKRIPKPKIGVNATLRIFLHNYPTLSVVIFILTGWFYFGYGIYLFEREHDADGYTFPGAAFASLVSMVCGYPADPYDTFTPATWPGKLLCLASTAWGLFLFALLIDSMDSRCRLDRYELAAAQWVVNYELQQRIREESARLIQAAWHKHKFEVDNENTAEDDVVYQRGVQKFDKMLTRHIKGLRNLLRLRARVPVPEALAPYQDPFTARPTSGNSIQQISQGGDQPGHPGKITRTPSSDNVGNSNLPRNFSTDFLHRNYSTNDLSSLNINLAPLPVPGISLGGGRVVNSNQLDTISVGGYETPPNFTSLNTSASSLERSSPATGIRKLGGGPSQLGQTDQSNTPTRVWGGLEGSHRGRAVTNPPVRTFTENEVRNLISEAVAQTRAQCLEDMASLLDRFSESNSQRGTGTPVDANEGRRRGHTGGPDSPRRI